MACMQHAWVDAESGVAGQAPAARRQPTCVIEELPGSHMQGMSPQHPVSSKPGSPCTTPQSAAEEADPQHTASTPPQGSTAVDIRALSPPLASEAATASAGTSQHTSVQADSVSDAPRRSHRLGLMQRVWYSIAGLERRAPDP